MNYLLSDMLKVYSGLEHINSNNYTSEEAVYLATFHNQRMNKPYNRSIDKIIKEDGLESIMGTVREWAASISKTINNWFKDYDKKELERIEKEVNGGLTAFQNASIKDSIDSLEKFRKLFNERFDKYYNDIKDKSLIKDLSKSEAKSKILKEIDHTLASLKNGKMNDFFLNQMKKESEKVMLRIVSKLTYLKRTHEKFKKIIEEKDFHIFLIDIGINETDIDVLKIGGNKIIKKLEMLDKNGVVYLDIIKSKIFVDVQTYIAQLNNLLSFMAELVYKYSKEVDRQIEKSEDYRDVILIGKNKKEYNQDDLQWMIYQLFDYIDGGLKSLRSFSQEVSNDITEVSLSLTGLPKNVIDVFLTNK